MVYAPKFPQPVAVHLMKIAHQTMYPEQYVSANDMILEADEGPSAGGVEYANTYNT